MEKVTITFKRGETPYQVEAFGDPIAIFQIVRLIQQDKEHTLEKVVNEKGKSLKFA